QWGRAALRECDSEGIALLQSRHTRIYMAADVYQQLAARVAPYGEGSRWPAGADPLEAAIERLLCADILQLAPSIGSGPQAA
ncbi:MAG TPA: hypothetical protein VGK73_07335, partial [Polyangiaceae bacterium]